MFENFDDLYNEFFGGKKRKRDDHFDKMKELLNKLNNFEDLHGEHMDNPYEKELGEPDEVTTYTEGPYTFEKKIWNLPTGQMVKVQMVSTPFDDDRVGSGVKIDDTLEEQLASALSEERYEDAAIIRDKINNKEVKPVKEDKSSTEDDEWNF